MAEHSSSDPSIHVINHHGYDKDVENAASNTDLTLHRVSADKLARKLSARQVQMIAIGGTIGTGLFLGTGKSLATGGPASMLICYFIVGAIVFLTMLALGEMAAFVPIAGSFCTFAGRYVDDALGFALTWNYWFNDAVSTAADLVALQLVFAYWDTGFPGWALSLIFWVFLIVANIITVRAYGEVCDLVSYSCRTEADYPLKVEYWLSLLKVVTITVSSVVLISIEITNSCSDIYHPRDRRKLRRQHLPPIHWSTQLVHRRRSVCWWDRRLCIGLRHSVFCVRRYRVHRHHRRRN